MRINEIHSSGMSQKKFDRWGAGQKNSYESDYYRLVTQSQMDLNMDRVFNKYLEIESTNDKLMRLKQKFGDNESSMYHLKSIYGSQYFKDTKPPKEANLAYNIVQNVGVFHEGTKLQPNAYDRFQRK